MYVEGLCMCLHIIIYLGCIQRENIWKYLLGGNKNISLM